MKGVIANNPRFRIIAETEDYLVVDKPAPLKVHPGAPNGAPALYDELRGLLAYELPVRRAGQHHQPAGSRDQRRDLGGEECGDRQPLRQGDA